MPRSARPGKGPGNTGGGGGGGIIKLLGALLGGVGGGAIANTPVDAEVAPEFEGAFTTPGGLMVSEPFSSSGTPNFWDKIAGNRDEAADLNNKLRLAGLLGKQSGLQEVFTKRMLGNLAIEQAGPTSKALTDAEIESRRRKIPVTEEETKSKNALELDQERKRIPIKGEDTATQTYASRGIMPQNIGNLSEWAAALARAGSQNQLTSADLERGVLENPQNQGLLSSAILAGKAAPIGALRNLFETPVAPNSMLYRDAIGNPALDRLLNPGMYTGNRLTRSEEPVMMTMPNGQEFPTGKTKTVEHLSPGGFEGIPAFDPVKATSALEKLNPRVTLSGAEPAPSQFSSRSALLSRPPMQGPQLQPAAPSPTNAIQAAQQQFGEPKKIQMGEQQGIQFKDLQGIQKILEWLLKGGATDVLR